MLAASRPSWALEGRECPCSVATRPRCSAVWRRASLALGRCSRTRRGKKSRTKRRGVTPATSLDRLPCRASVSASQRRGSGQSKCPGCGGDADCHWRTHDASGGVSRFVCGGGARCMSTRHHPLRRLYRSEFERVLKVYEATFHRCGISYAPFYTDLPWETALGPFLARWR